MAFHQRLFFLLLLLLPTQLGLHFWPEWAYVLGRRIDYLSPTLYVTDLLIIFILLFWFVERFPGIMRETRKKFSPASFITHHFSFMILCLFAVFNIWFAASPWVAFYKWVKVLEFIGLGWYIVQTRPPSWVIITPLIFSTVFSSVLAIVQFFLQHSVGGIFWVFGERTFTLETPGIARMDFCLPLFDTCRLLLRPYATLPHPNVLGGFIAVMIPLMLSFYTKQMPVAFPMKRSFFIVVWWLILLLGLVALFMTFSRSAWIVTAIGILLYVAEHHMRRNPLPLIFFSLVLLVSAFVFRPSFQDETVIRRTLLQESAVDLWKNSPFVGAGLGNFVVALPHVSDFRQINFLQPVHNIYLLVLSETGVFGFMILVWVMVRSFRKSRYRLPIILLLLVGLVDHYPFTLQQGQLLTTILLARMIRK